MWVVTNTGLISIVEDRMDSSMVYVRARRKSDLISFISDVDVPFDIIHSPNNDYDYRVHMSKSILSKILAELPSKINYSNFKNSIPKEDIMLKDFASRVWNAGFVTLKESTVEFFKLVNQRRRESELNTP